MATLQTQEITQAGLQPALSAASSGGDSYVPSSTTILLVKNGDTQPHTITVHTTAVAFCQPISNIAITLPAASETLLGPYEPGEVAQPGTGLCNLTYDAVTNVTLAALQV